MLKDTHEVACRAAEGEEVIYMFEFVDAQKIANESRKEMYGSWLRHGSLHTLESKRDQGASHC
jgi:hypothetical protein